MSRSSSLVGHRFLTGWLPAEGELHDCRLSRAVVGVIKRSYTVTLHYR